MQTITYEEACEIFTDAQCVSVPYKYHNMGHEQMQLYLGLLSKENKYGLGGDFINATLTLGHVNNMHIISPSEHYVVKDVTEKEYDAFYIARAYDI